MSRHFDRQHRIACLIDGDNITQGGQVGVAEFSRILSRLSELTAGWPVAFAMQRRLAADYMTAYAGLGWGIRFASMEPDAADVILLDEGADFVAHDVRDLVVISGDHVFADMAGQARLHVFSYRKCLSKRLRLAATNVTYLDDLLPAAA